jgi:hypothetical protein
VTETFPGTISAQGTSQHFFKVNQDSEIDVTLTRVTTVAVQADPNANPPVVGVPAMPVSYSLTVRIGQQAISTLGVTCSDLKSVLTPAGATPQIRGQALAGTFCVAVSDPNGTLPQPVSYVVTVAHS